MKNYEPDDGALTRDQIEQIRDRVRQQDEIELVDFIRLAILEEREACAKLEIELILSPAFFATMGEYDAHKDAVLAYRNLIRARGNK